MGMSRTGHVIRNSKYGLISKLLTVFLSFASRTIFIEQLGAEYLGVEGLFTNILTILSLAELGIGNVLTYSLYEPIANQDHDKVNELLAFYKKVYFVIFMTVLVIGIILIPFLPYIVTSSFSNGEIVKFYLMYLLNSAISYVAVYYTTLIKAEQEQYLIDIVTTGVKIGTIILQIICLIFTGDFMLFLLIMIAGTLMQNVIASCIARKRYDIRKCRQKKTTIDKSHIIKNVKSTFLYKIGVVIINYTDNILISILVGTIYVGYYSNYVLITNQVSGIISILCTAIIASIGNLSAERDSQKANTVFRRLVFSFHYISAVCAIGFILLFNDLIDLWIGESFTLGIATVAALSFSFYIQNIINPIWMYREAYGLFEQIKYLMLATAVINIVLSVIGGKLWGIAGIIGATGVARCLTTVWYEPSVLYKKVFNRKTFEYFKQQGWYVVCTGIALLVSVVLCGMIGGAGIVSFVIKGIIIVIASTLIFYGLNFRSEELRYWTEFLLDKLRVKRIGIK